MFIKMKREAFHTQFEDLGAPDTAFPYLLLVSQADTERLLEDALREKGVTVERPAKVVGVEDLGEHAVVTLESGERIDSCGSWEPRSSRWP